MKPKAVRSVVTAIALLVVVLCSSRVHSIQSNSPSYPDANAKPLLLERNEGEVRTRRIHTDASVPASTQFMLKVSPKNNGSQHLVAGTEGSPQERPYRSTGT